MAKQTVKIALEIELDTDEVAPKTPQVWLYQFINRLNYEFPVRAVEYEGKRRVFTSREEVKELALNRRDDM